MTHQPSHIKAAAASPALSVIIACDQGSVNGGQAKVAIESALALKQRGVDVCFVAGSGPLDQRLQSAGIECHAVGEYDILSDPKRFRAATSGIWNRSAARVLSQCIGARDPRSTVIHVHGWAKALSPSIGPIVTGSEAAHVYTLHEYFLACPNGGFFDYRAGEICNRKALGLDCLRTNCDPRARSHKMWRVARQAVLWSAGRMPSGVREIIYLAPEQRSIMRSYVSSEAHWHYLPNVAGPQPTRRIAAEQNGNFLFIGRLSPEKGAEVAARAAAISRVPITFCGDGECHDAIQRANPDARMLGWLGADELMAEMRRARCLVFPSLWYEAYGLVVADALRVGLPVLASASSLGASLVPHMEAGCHVKTGDVDAWAKAMTYLRSDDVVRDYSQAAFRAGQQLPSSEEYTSRLIEIYLVAISRKHKHDLQVQEFAL